jgi:hypothetical protein
MTRHPLLKSLAQSQGLSMNKLVKQLRAHALAAWDTENDFRAMAATGGMNKALGVLDRLDTADVAFSQNKIGLQPP